MTEIKKTLDQLYVATPCTADWDKMRGSDQIRFCNQCQLNVYNISALTRKEAEALIASTEEKLCTKLFRRSDGTIITQDCPVGLRAIKKRVSRFATAALGFLLSVISNQTIGWADDGHKYCKHYVAKITRLQNTDNFIVITGIVDDQQKAVIANAYVEITNEETKQTYKTSTNAEGTYRFSLSQDGTYSIKIQSPGFVIFNKNKMTIKSSEMLQLSVTMQVGSVGGAAFLPTVPRHQSNLLSRNV